MNLNLPGFDLKIVRNPSGQLQVYDSQRGKYVALTPEEWVRQHFVNYLVCYKNYPPHLLANEVGLQHNGVKRRCDTVVYDRAARPLAIVEYKASTVNLSPAVFDQIVRYNMALHVKWLIVSNGVDSYCCRVDSTTNKYAFVNEIPSYEDLL